MSDDWVIKTAERIRANRSLKESTANFQQRKAGAITSNSQMLWEGLRNAINGKVDELNKELNEADFGRYSVAVPGQREHWVETERGRLDLSFDSNVPAVNYKRIKKDKQSVWAPGLKDERDHLMFSYDGEQVWFAKKEKLDDYLGVDGAAKYLLDLIL